jgi:hypothetical protein
VGPGGALDENEKYPPPQTVHPEASHYSDYTILASTVYISYYTYRDSAKRSCYARQIYRGADKSLARPTSRCILFDGENISFDASLVLYIYICINSTNIPPIMIINRIYETQNLLSL